jgi:hypothetical protein
MDQQPVLPQTKHLLSLTTDVFGYQSVGALPGFPLEWVYNGGTSQSFWGQTAGNTIVEEAQYIFVVSALRVCGDKENDDDWVRVETVPFFVEYST